MMLCTRVTCSAMEQVNECVQGRLKDTLPAECQGVDTTRNDQLLDELSIFLRKNEY